MISQRMLARNKSIALIVTLIGIGIFSYLCVMLTYFPLFAFAINDLIWTREWLYMTILDYEGAAMCLSLIAIFSEPYYLGFLWAIAFCLLGSPFCCVYIAYRLYFKSICLKDDDYRPLYANE